MGIEDEIKEITEDVVNKIEMPEFPKEMEVTVLNPLNLDLSKVEKLLQRLADKKEVKEIDLQGVEQGLKNVVNQIKELPKPEQPVDITETLTKVLTAVQNIKLNVPEQREPRDIDFSELLTELKKISAKPVPRGGGAIGPSKLKLTKASDGGAIDPAQSFKEGQKVSRVEDTTTTTTGTLVMGVGGGDKANQMLYELLTEKYYSV